jgi:SAM-dependent methyltransferase
MFIPPYADTVKGFPEIFTRAVECESKGTPGEGNPILYNDLAVAPRGLPPFMGNPEERPLSLTDEILHYYSERSGEFDETAGYLHSRGESLREPLKAEFRSVLGGHDVLEIASGTGYWTQVIAETARSVLATDASESMIALARKRLYGKENVTFRVADAYSLAGVSGRFTAAFSHWWWSHIPKSRIPSFISALHGKLVGGAVVLLSDQLFYPFEGRRIDEEGNILEKRTLRDGRTFEVVKNFPTREELLSHFTGIAEEIEYKESREMRSWTLTYRVKKAEGEGS